MHNRSLMSAHHLSKTVPIQSGSLTILDNVAVKINRGDSLAIIGASGSGKSTLLGLLAGLDVPSAGEVWLDDVCLSALDEDGRARLRAAHMGFVFQSFQLLPSLTALENVMLPLELSGSRDAMPQARDWLERVGLGTRLEHTPRQLSGGEQQRVAIARAFATRPALLFADEPTGNLDHNTGAKVIDLLFELNRAQQTTLVLVTHDSSLADRCTTHLQLDAGRCVETRA